MLLRNDDCRSRKEDTCELSARGDGSIFLSRIDVCTRSVPLRFFENASENLLRRVDAFSESVLLFRSSEYLPRFCCLSFCSDAVISYRGVEAAARVTAPKLPRSIAFAAD